MNNVESLGYVCCGYGYMIFFCHEKKHTCSQHLAVSVTRVLEHLPVGRNWRINWTTRELTGFGHIQKVLLQNHLINKPRNLLKHVQALLQL